MTENGPVQLELVKIDSRIPSSIYSTLLRKLKDEGLVYDNDNFIEVNPQSRLKLAVKAIKLGADIELVSDFLRWQEFEEIAAIALKQNGYSVAKNVHFKHEGKRREIDVVGCKDPLVVCIDCKRWHHGMHPSTLRNIAAAQSDRVAAFAASLPKTTMNLQCTRWSVAQFIPVILSLIPVHSKFCDDVPIVPVLQMQDFIYQLPLNLDRMKRFVRKFDHL